MPLGYHLVWVGGLCAALVASGCATDETAGKSAICQVHHVAMKKTVAYRPSSSCCLQVQYPPEFQKKAKANPNSVEAQYAWKTSGKFTHEPVTIYVCPECEKAFER